MSDPVDSCRLGLCTGCGAPWPRHIRAKCPGKHPRIMEHLRRVLAKPKGGNGVHE